MSNTRITVENRPGLALAVLTVVLLLALQPNPIRAEEVTLEFRGLTLNANLELADGKAVSDGVVLIVHGYLAHNKMEIIRTSQRALLDNGHSSLAINLSLGVDNRHGFYDCTLPHRHLQENAVDEIAAWVDWLKYQGVSRITLMGHSRGANQAMIYVAEQRDPLVTQLVMLAPGLTDNIEIFYRDRYGISVDETRNIAYRQVGAGKGKDLMPDIDLLSCPKALVTAESFLSYYSVDNKFRQLTNYLSEITVPTLVIAGSLDDRQPDIATVVTPLVGSHYVRLGVIEGAGHFFRDFNTDEAMEMAVEFIDDTRS